VPGSPDPGWRTLDANPLAPIAVAHLIDSDRYLGSNPGISTTPSSVLPSTPTRTSSAKIESSPRTT
jgi:hypothetical protein